MPDILTARFQEGSAANTMPTHWIPYDSQRYGRRQQKALCGQIVDTNRHAPAPTCIDCLRALERFEGLEF